MTLTKQLGIFIVLIASLFIFYAIHTQIFLRLTSWTQNASTDIPKSHPHLSPSSVYYQRAKHLAEQCRRSQSESRDLSSVMKSIQKHHKSFAISRSRSVMQCITLKVASTTMRTAMIYAHLREVYNHITAREKVPNFGKKKARELIKIASLIKIFRKVNLLLE